MDIQDEVREVQIAIVNAIQKKTLDISSALRLVVDCMKIVEQIPTCQGKDKKAILLKCLQEIAKGNDGVAGTDDDVIGKDVMNALSILLNENIIDDVVEFIIDVSKGKLNIGDLQKVSKGVLGACLVCFGKKHK
jgi:hypothetical protein